jgi:hypothetical protein
MIAVWSARAIVAVAVLYGLGYLGLRLMLSQAISGARTEHIAIDEGDLATLPVTDPNNAAASFALAFDKMSENDNGHNRGVVLGIAVDRSTTNSDRERDYQAAQVYQPALRLAELACEKPDCSFPINYGEGVHLRFPELALMKMLVRLETLIAKLKLSAHQESDSLRHLAYAEKISQDMATIPNFSGRTDFVGAQTQIFHAIILMLCNENASLSFVQGVKELLDHAPQPPKLKYYVGGELVLNRQIIRKLPAMSDAEYDDLLAGEEEGEPKEKLKRLLRIATLNPLYEENYISYYRAFLKNLPQDELNWPVMRVAAAKADSYSSELTVPKVCTVMFSKGLVSICADSLKCTARNRMLGVACRLLLLKKLGRPFPSTMPDFGLVGTDPFSGKPFLYNLTPKGFQVYSVGQNGGGIANKGAQDLMVEYPNRTEQPPANTSIVAQARPLKPVPQR